MAQFAFKGLDAYELKLSKLAAGTEKIAGKAIYKGAGIVADEIKRNLQGVPEETGKPPKGKLARGLSPAQKRGLEESFGITDMDLKDGYYNVKLGFDGYNSIVTKKYPRGQPNQMIARSTESGSSVREKHPFVRTAVRKTRIAAVKAIGEVVDSECEKIMK